jgi:hypothetical protein
MLNKRYSRGENIFEMAFHNTYACSNVAEGLKIGLSKKLMIRASS